MLKPAVLLMVLSLILATSFACSPDVPPASPTPKPSATAASPTTFTDDFSNPKSGWKIDSDANYEQGYAAGEYFVKFKEWGTVLSTNQNLMIAWDNVTVEVDVKVLTNFNEYAGIGIRVTNNAMNSLGFYVMPGTGMWAIGRVVNDDLTFLVKPTVSDAIKKGNAVNRLKVVAQGATLQFYINGQSVGTANDPKPVPGAVTLEAARPESGKVAADVRFDNFRWERQP